MRTRPSSAPAPHPRPPLTRARPSPAPPQVREAQLAQYNYILVVGEAEKTAQTVNVRTRDNVVHGMFKLSDVRELMVLVSGGRGLGGEGLGGVRRRAWVEGAFHSNPKWTAGGRGREGVGGGEGACRRWLGDRAAREEDAEL